MLRLLPMLLQTDSVEVLLCMAPGDPNLPCAMTVAEAYDHLRIKHIRKSKIPC